MKMPKYLNVVYKDRKPYLVIAKWGVPILLFKTIKNNLNFKWWEWLMFPYLCIELMCKV